MAKRIYFPDGSHEDILCTEYPENDMARIIRERLGDDFANMCDPYIFGSEEYQKGDDYERIADGYLSLLHEAADELETVIKMFDAPRLDRRAVERSLIRVHKNILKNL